MYRLRVNVLQRMKRNIIDWILRLCKGAIIGTGFILPGVSGGALAAVFGLYERIVSFIAHITKNLMDNILFFIPVGLGALLGMFLLAHPLLFVLEHYEVQVLWGFAGCIIGTLPSLWKTAGKEGRDKKYYIILILTAIIGLGFLYTAKKYGEVQLPLNFLTWIFAGILISLGILIPGMSPSNFLLYFGMYEPMIQAFKTMDFPVLLPILIGSIVCLFSLSNLIALILKKAYTGFFHFVIGIVIASTIMIIPLNYNYLNTRTFVCIAAAGFGALLGFWMGRLETKYKSIANNV